MIFLLRTILLWICFVTIFSHLSEWKMYQLEVNNAKCNDGTPYKYFLRRGNSNKWNLYLMGGWWCFDEISCQYRDIDLKSSKNLNVSYVEYVDRGIFSQNKTLNPTFYDFNHVYLYYCSSDAWSGTSMKENDNDLGYSFVGKNNLKGVINELVGKHEIKEENLEVVLSGSSAGGVGVMVNADFVKTILSNLFQNFQYKSIADSGLLWIRTPIDTRITSVMKQMELGYDLWKAQTNENCEHLYKEKWKCYFMEYNLDVIQSDLFVFDDRFDLWQIEWNLGIFSQQGTKLDLKHNLTQINWANNFGKYAYDTVTSYFSTILEEEKEEEEYSRKKGKGCFLSSCFNHCAVGSDDFNKFGILVKKKGVRTLQETISTWWVNGSQEEGSVMISECSEFDCSYGCPVLP